MTLFSLAFLGGIVLLQFFVCLPPLSLAIAAVFGCSILYWKKWRGHSLLIPILLGFAWCLWYAHSIAKFSLLPAWEGKTLWVKGQIASLPRISSFQTAFRFQVSEIHADNHISQVSTLINLTWPHSRRQNSVTARWLRVGDEWLFPVRLKKIHSTLNPGGFDFEAWAFQNGIRARGYVVEKEKPVFIGSHFFFHPIDQLRQVIQDKAKKNLTPSQTSPWLMALMIGERSDISQTDWAVLRNTGTNHLMAIAGLHIGFLSAFTHWLTQRLWRRPQWILRIPAPQAGACASLLMALLYSALAGFSIPTQRALVMIAVYLSASLFRRVIPLWQAWSLALLIVLLLNPLSVLSSSFWLSFMTLALIFYGMQGRLAPPGRWWKWGRPQWVLALGLLPLSLWFFMQYSVVSFLANLIAIPWIGFVVLPLCFLSILFLLSFSWLAPVILLLADKSLALLWSLLVWFSHWPWAIWHQVVPQLGFLFMAMVGVFILLFPLGFPGRYLGFLWLLPLFCFKPIPPQRGELRFTLLDVGQGLAAVIQTQQHVLIFDTGARFGPEFDQGEAVVLPFLYSQGIKKIDMLVISHGDNDHSGGAQAILSKLPVSAIQTSVPQQFAAWSAEYCLAGKSWVWDEVHFAFLYPTLSQLNLGNDSSCVLQVATPHKRILIPGDIEKRAEKFLLLQTASDLSADLLIAPHHGSKTSGWRDFIAQVHPNYVLYPIGYRNRYHFPHPTVMQTYRELGAIQYDTSSSGAIQFEVGKDYLFPSEFYRRRHKRYWNEF